MHAFKVVVMWLPLTLCLGILVGCQQSASQPLNGVPRITVVQPSRSLGVIPLRPRTETFKVTNTGNAELRIARLERSCSCAKADIDRDVIRSGETAHIQVTITPKESEQRSAAINIYSNDVNVPKTRISLEWTARGAVTADSEVLDFGVVRPLVPVSRSLVVRRSIAEIPVACETKIAISPPGAMKAELKESLEKDGLLVETWQFTLLPGDESDGQTGRVLVKVQGSQQGGISIPTTWMVRKKIEVSPRRVFLGSARPASRVTKTLELTTDQGEELKVGQVRCSNEKIVVDTKMENVSPDLIQLELSFTFPEQVGSHFGELQIECESPEITRLRVPITLVVTP